MMRMRMSDDKERKRDMILNLRSRSRSRSDIDFKCSPARAKSDQSLHHNSTFSSLSSREHAQRCAHIISW